ncbi:hypothetical protein [Catellatospora sp. IY07-71]|uniref:hypothetical protein n=1 Tax=Catellatospora sp. IY07-71 TaxID=2728827 RepID=UPI001BB33F1C|nr:hypothetical protein [Catellatospora sp. IY07-71]
MTEPHSSSNTRRRVDRIAVPAVAAMAGMLLGGGVVALIGGSEVGDPFTVDGTATVTGAKREGELCPDLPDDRVHVLSETGVIIAVGHLKKEAANRQLQGTSCAYPFTVTEVPGGHVAYGVVLPGMNEPPQIYSAAVLREQLPLQLTGTFRITLANTVRS